MSYLFCWLLEFFWLKTVANLLNLRHEYVIVSVVANIVLYFKYEYILNYVKVQSYVPVT